MHVKAGTGAVKLDSQIPSDRAEVVCLKLLLKVSFQFGNELEITAGEEDVVNVDEQSNSIISYVSKVEIRIGMGLY